MKSLSRRCTIRRYSQKNVTDEMLHELLTAASRTQTMGNLQLYSVVITRNAEMKKRLLPAHFGQEMVVTAPVVLTICADFRRTTLWAEARSASPAYDNILSFVNAASDALLYTQTFCNLADEVGLGYCYLGTTVYNPQMIIETLSLPPLVMPVASLTLGWPDESPVQTDRLPLAAFIHDETYKDYDAQCIDAFYRAKEELPENQKHVKLNNKQTLAQVFTDVRYTREINECISKVFVNALRRQGFLK